MVGYMKQKTIKTRKKGDNRTFRKIIICLLILLGLVAIGLAIWATAEYRSERQVKTSQNTINSKYKNIELKSDNYHDEFFHANVTYVVSENQTINDDIRKVVDATFEPCKAAGQRNTSAIDYECNASPEINFATDDYLEVTYSFRQFPSSQAAPDVATRQTALLYNRKSGARLTIADLFKPNAQYLPKLTDLTRNVLNNKFNAAYYSQFISHDAMMRATEPKAANFNDFILSSDEKLIVIFEPGEVAPVSEGVIQAELPTDQLYDLFAQPTIDVFLPKLKAQREAAAKLAAEAAAARERAKEVVGENRENIDCSKMKCIALTYDDGPYAPNGNRLMDILKERNAVATFCMVGNRVATYTTELKRVVDEKHEICNHSWDHSDLTNLSDADVASQIQRTNQAIYNASGLYPKLMRPPYGAVNARVVAQINMPLAMWSVDTLDWKDRNPDIVYQRAIAGAKPGAVILMHEIHSTTIDAAARIVDELQDQGYVLVTMSELFGITKDNLTQFDNKKLFQR
jgi:peptidoglycan/xylan/chitin deacetylase (PgdA/CDA1 family)